MVKVYRGGEVRLEPPQTGWGVVWFADGHKAQGGHAEVVTREGKSLIRFYLYPYPSIVKKFNIDKKDLDKGGYCYKWYPKEFVRLLNTYDPSRPVYFCILNWNGEKTDATEWFLGGEQSGELIRLREKIRELQAHNSKLKIENIMLKTNVQKYLKENAEIFKYFMPTFKSMFSPERSGEIYGTKTT